MAHRFRELTGPAWLAKRVRLSLVAVALSLLIGVAGLAHSGNWLVSAQSNDFDADAEDIWLDPSTVYAGQSVNIRARFQNLSPSSGPHGGEATFDVTIYVEPPTGTATRFSWDNQVFTLDQERTFNKAYTFAESGTYTIRAEIYDINGQQSGWNADNRFDQLTETFTVREPVTVQISQSSYTVDEDAGEVEITVTMSESLSSAAEVTLKARDDTANSRDYGSLPATVAFPPNTTSQTKSVTIREDQTLEATRKTFYVVLDVGTDPRLSVNPLQKETAVTIVDDDEVTVGFGHTVYTQLESRSVTICLEVISPDITYPSDVPFTVHFSYTDLHGVGLSGPSSLPFDRGRIRTCGSYQIADDNVVEEDSQVEFTLDSVTSDSPGVASRVKFGIPTATLNVIDSHDRAFVEFEHPSYSVREGNAVELCAVLRHPATVAFPFTVDLSYTDRDGALSSGPTSFSFGPLDANSCVEFQTQDDDVGSGASVVSFRLTRPTDLDRRISVSTTTVRLTVIDDETSPPTPNRAPTVSRVSPSASSITLETGDSRTFQASATDPDANITSYEWTVKGRGVGNSGSLSPTGNTSRTHTHTFSNTGPHTVRVEFTDVEGATGSTSWSVNVQEPRPDPPPPPPTSNSAPTVTIASPVSPVHLETGETRTFTARATDDDNNLTKWKWVVDKHGVLTDGRESPEVSFASTGRILKSFSHTFPDDGTYTVTVTFIDSSGESDSEEWRVEVEDPPKVDDKSVTHTCGTDPATPTAGDEFTIVSEVTAGEDLDDVFVRFDFSDPAKGLYDRARAPENSSKDISAGDTVRLTAPAIVSHGGDGWVLKCTVMREAGFFEGYLDNRPRQLAVEEKAITINSYTQNSEESDVGYLKSCGGIANEGGKLGAEFIRKNPGMEVRVNSYLFKEGERVWEGSAYKDAGSTASLFTLTFPGQPELQGEYALDCEMTVKPFHKEISIQYLLAVPTCISNPFVFTLCAVFLAYDLSTEWALIDSVSSNFCVGGYPGCPFSYYAQSDISPPIVRAGEPVTLSFRTSGLNGAADHGGVTVSFPDLTDVGTRSSDYDYVSDRASVSTVSYTTGTSNVTYHRPGTSVQTDGGASDTAEYLLVESDDSYWPNGADRTLDLEVTPWEPGMFQVQYRYWLCLAGNDECRRDPESGDVDQQGWHVGVSEITVNAVPDRDELVEFHEATGGPNWHNDTDWLSHAPLDNWHGVDTVMDDRVTVLELPSNNLSGPIPTVLGDLTGLEALDLSRNGLTGKIPAALESLTALTTLDLSRNGLTGEIPAALGDLTALTTLDLSTNDLDGRIPSELGRLTGLEALRLYDNDLNRPIPVELGNLTNLTELDLSDNRLSGWIPTQLDKLANLQVLDLSDNNRLTGAIPEGLGNLQHLDTVYLSGNSLDRGCIPARWRDLDNLDNHDLDDVDLPFCDVALSALAVSPVELKPRFDPGVSKYTAEVEDGQVTITPATSHGATFQLLDGEGESVPDADGALGGHQIAVGYGAPPSGSGWCRRTTGSTPTRSGLCGQENPVSRL